MAPDHPAASPAAARPGPVEGRPVLVVKSGAGLDDAERCVQAVTVAATAVAAGAQVSLWLMGDAVQLAVPGIAEGFVLEGSPPLAGLRDAVLGAGEVTVCTQCAARRGLSEADLLPGVRIAGAASYVEEILRPGVQALIY
jgi:predicted peroxiredoxin